MPIYYGKANPSGDWWVRYPARFGLVTDWFKDGRTAYGFAKRMCAPGAKPKRK